MEKELENKRASKRCYNLQLNILASKKWKKMVERIELWDGRKAHDMHPCEIIVWRRKYRTYLAYAYTHRIVVYDGWYKTATPKELRRLLTHEMAHSFLAQNRNDDHHGEYFKTACYLLGLETSTRERAFKYIGRCSECGFKHKKSNYKWNERWCPVCKANTKLKNRRSKAKLKVRKECPSTQVDASIIDVGEMGSMPQVADSIAPIISMRRTER